MKYEKVTEYSSELKKWLDLINSVPLGSGIYHSWQILWGAAYFQLTGEDIAPLIPPPPELDYGDWQPPSYEQQEALDEAFIKATKTLKSRTEAFPKLHSYLFEIENSPASENRFDEIRYAVRTMQYEKSAHQRYERFLQMRLDIRAVARSCMDYRKKGYFVDNDAIFERLGFKNRDKGYLSKLIIKNGIVDFESELIQVLRGIAPERLRICPICDDVFWAKRIETSTCSKKRCSNNFHQRKLRIAEYEKRLSEQFEAFKKLESGLSPENSLVEQQRRKLNKLSEKINRERMKNGNL